MLKTLRQIYILMQTKDQKPNHWGRFICDEQTWSLRQIYISDVYKGLRIPARAPLAIKLAGMIWKRKVAVRIGDHLLSPFSPQYYRCIPPDPSNMHLETSKKSNGEEGVGIFTSLSLFTDILYLLLCFGRPQLDFSALCCSWDFHISFVLMNLGEKGWLVCFHPTLVIAQF